MSASHPVDNPDAERRGGPWGRRSAPRPLLGVTCPVLTTAIRQVERELLKDAPPADHEPVAQLLAGVALAVGQRAPTFVVQLSPRHPAALVRRVLDLLRSALLHAWSDKVVGAPPLRVLRHLASLEALREALEHDAVQAFGARLAGPDGADILAEVVHDLRSPLSSILFLADTLEQGRSGSVSELQRRQLRLIHIAALQLTAISNDAIDLARGGDLLRDEHVGPFSVTALLENVRDVARPIAEEKKLAIRLLPPEHDYRLGREFALRRILLNLLVNGLKFTKQGHVEVSVEERGPDRVEFSVRDTGPGISAQAVENLFRPFRRIATAQRHRFSSTGLGLAVSRRLVEALDGTLRYETSPTWGTRFWFEIALPPVDAPAAQVSDEAEARP